MSNNLDSQSKSEFVASAKGLAKWFSVDIEIRIFGVVIWSYHFPPSKNG